VLPEDQIPEFDPYEKINDDARAEMRKRSRRDFLAGGVAAAGAYAAWHWIRYSAPVDGIQKPLREAFKFNSAVSRALLGDRSLSPTFPVDKAVTDVRLNGNIGIDPTIKLDTWRLQVTGLAKSQNAQGYVPDIHSYTYAEDETLADQDTAPETTDDKGGGVSVTSTITTMSEDGEQMAAEPGLLLTLDHIRSLPHVEMVTQLKCIEGWSEIVHWGGARLSDFITAYHPDTSSLPKYVGMDTPNGEYYVGLFKEDALHPQTLLCYEMNGQPLSREHGAPLRLVTPIKYGIKHLKQIGRISFTNERPHDYWAENGYDWNAGH
jgi:DMSO/TMAO reductase YedYZ molybdopterin-dependent catalytic subunit